eukprot:8734949-Alexandrium_andersonii.AAC.1
MENATFVPAAPRMKKIGQSGIAPEGFGKCGIILEVDVVPVLAPEEALGPRPRCPHSRGWRRRS